MMGIPRQRSQAIAFGQSEGLQRGGKPQAALLRGGIAGAVDAAVDIARNDFRFTMRGRGVAKNIRRQQRCIHHQAEHDGCPPWFLRTPARLMGLLACQEKMLTAANRIYKQSSLFYIRPPDPRGRDH